MCGIVGFINLNDDMPASQADVVAMADQIVHRGPDDAGYHVDGPCAIGMRRLSIIDLGGGHQPIHTPDGRYTIVFNGEVYNYREQRSALEATGHQFSTNSDTEVVLHLFQEYGEGFVEHLNGMFGIAIWDSLDKRLTLVRDRLGIKPLYIYQDDKVLVFASEIKALLAHPAFNPSLSDTGLNAYLRYGFTPAPLTMFKGVRKLPPACLLTVQARDISEREYWRLSYQNKFTASESQLTEELYELLKSSVQYQMISDVPLGAFLSGGIDSSGIVHLMSELSDKPPSTYCIGFGAGFEQYNELDSARRFAKDYGTDHHEILVTPDVANLFPTLIPALDEPVADSSFLVTYLVSALARESVTVILSGVGGDELFGGYRRYLSVSLNKYVSAIPAPIRSKVLRPLLEKLPVDRNSKIMNLLRLARGYLSAAELPAEQQYGQYIQLLDTQRIRELTVNSSDSPDFYARYYEDCDSDDLLDHLMYFDLKMSLPEQLLMLSDKMSMHTSLEARVPFLDHRVVEFAARLPAQMKINGFKLRHLQKRTFRNRFPDYVFEQKKKGFGAPIGVWLRNELKEMLSDLLSSSRLQRQGIFNPKVVQTMMEEHFAMRADYTDHLLALMAFQIWADHYLPSQNGG